MTALAAATFDVGFVCAQLERNLGGLRPAEIHSVTYLSCLLSIYDGCAPGAWEYLYTSTKAGTPFSPDIDQAIDRMLAGALLAEDGQLLVLSEKGRGLLQGLRALPSLSGRERFLEPACSVTLTMPLPAVTEALLHEPQLEAAVSLGQLRPLLDETGLAVVRPHLVGLRAAMSEHGPLRDLIVPAIVWMSYLSRSLEQTGPSRAG